MVDATDTQGESDPGLVTDVLEKAKKAYERNMSAWSRVYEKALDDLYFLSDNAYAQWDNRVYNERKAAGYQVLQIDQLSQFIHQVANDIRQNTPSVDVIPARDGDEETAEIFQGLIRAIQYKSNADDVYDTAVLNAIRGSIGFIRVDHDYESDTGFEQELCIKRVVNPLACWIDDSSVECDGRDAKNAILLEDMDVSSFKQRFPGFEPSCFSGRKQRQWTSNDRITVAEFFWIEEESKKFGLTESGQVVAVEDDGQYLSKRTMTKKKVMRAWVSGQDVLEQGQFPGKYIPIVPVYGEEAWVNGERNIYSLIRKSKDVQYMFNLWASLETDLLLKQPQAPVMVAAGSIENYAEDWKNPSKSMALRYDQTNKKGERFDPPQRLAPPQIPTGIVNAKRETLDDIKATLGMYNASIGAKSNETSGIAINARKVEGEVATYHFGDNLVRSITQVGRVLVAAIPEVYDTSRVINIVDIEGEVSKVGVNGRVVPKQKRQFDLTKGQFDVRVTTGASFTTKRQETATALQELFARAPDLMPILGDLYFKNADFAGSQAMAERMKKVVEAANPGLTADKDDEQQVDPQKQQMAVVIQEGQVALQQMQAEIANLQQQLKDKQADTALKAKSMQFSTYIDELKLQQQQEQMLIDAQAKRADLDIKLQELMLKQQDMEIKAMQAYGAAQQPEVEPIDVEKERATIIARIEEEEMDRKLYENTVQMIQQQNQMLQQSILGVQKEIQQLGQFINTPREVEYRPDGRIKGIK